MKNSYQFHHPIFISPLRRFILCCVLVIYVMYGVNLHENSSRKREEAKISNVTLTWFPSSIQSTHTNHSGNVIKKHFGRYLHSSPNSCTCALVPMLHEDVYNEYLSQPISGLNLTTIQVLKRQHPNFPVDLLLDVNGKWCDLLPSPLE